MTSKTVPITHVIQVSSFLFTICYSYQQLSKRVCTCDTVLRVKEAVGPMEELQ